MLEPTKKRRTEAVELRLRVRADSVEAVRVAVAPYLAEEDGIPWRESLGVKPEDEPGCYLRGARLKEGLTQKELATALGVSQHHVSEMEHNKRPIGKDMAKRLAEKLSINYRLFL